MMTISSLIWFLRPALRQQVGKTRMLAVRHPWRPRMRLRFLKPKASRR
jgi:hypothetical protein